MKFIKQISLTAFILVFVSCANTGSVKSNNDNIERKEVVSNIASDSPEKMNLDLGVGYLKRGNENDLDFAMEKFKKAIKFNPKYSLAHSMLANVYDKKGLFESAEIHYEKSIKYNNGSPDVVNNYANFLCQRESYDKAIENYLKVVSNPIYKTPYSAYENAGVCAKRAGYNDKAKEYFRKALSINNKLPNPLYYLMVMYLQENEYMNARAFLQRLEQVVQPSSEMLSAGYKIEKALNHDELAQKYLTTLKSKFPNSESLKKL